VLGALSFHVDLAPTAQVEGDFALWASLDEKGEHVLYAEIDSAAKEFFGPNVHALTTVGAGTVVIETILIAYGALKIYREAVENLDWFRMHVGGLIRRFFGPNRVVISSESHPAGGPATMTTAGLRLGDPLVLYLVISHAGMLAVLLWQLVEHL